MDPLPLEIQQIIFQQLPQKDLIGMTSTSKYFNKLMKNIRWDHKEIKIHRIEEIQYVMLTYKFPKITISSCPSLINCSDMDSVDPTECEIMFNHNMQYLTFCYEVNLSNCRTINFDGLRYLSNCKILNLSRCDFLTDYALQYLGNCHQLDLSHCYRITNDGLQYLGNCKKINLSGCTLITDAGLQYLGNCKKINLSYCYSITDAGLQYLGNCKKINLSDCHLITCIGLQHIGSCEKINIYGCKMISWELQQYLISCHKIKIINKRSYKRDHILLPPSDGYTKDSGLRIGEMEIDSGLRIGKMERDAMSAFGVFKFLKERIMNNSDSYTCHMCGTCQNDKNIIPGR